MGCVNSRKKLHNENIFHVSIVRAQPQLSSIPRHGQLELTPRELIFRSPNKEPLIWPLQHLRRYGLNGNVFSFEAGRRCIMGARIYTFRCYQADLLYQRFQQYVNGVGEISILRSNIGIHGGQVQYGSHTEANHYQEQVTTILPSSVSDHHHHLRRQPNNLNALSMATINRDQETENNFQNSSLSIAEVSYLGNHSSNTIPATAKSNSTNNNIYMKQPLRSVVEKSNESLKAYSKMLFAKGVSCSSNKLNITNSSPVSSLSDHSRSTLKSNVLSKNDSNIVEGKEKQPYYMNVETTVLDRNNLTPIKLKNQSSVNCKFNLSDIDQFASNLENEEIPKNYTQTSHPNNGLEVNYIVLDLDNSESLLSNNTLNRTPFSDCEFHLPVTTIGPNVIDRVDEPYIVLNSAAKRSPLTMSLINTAITTTFPGTIHPSENVDSYSTIDFVRTSALLNQSNDMENLDKNEGCEQEEIESRLTRHSKCISKVFNVDEVSPKTE